MQQLRFLRELEIRMLAMPRGFNPKLGPISPGDTIIGQIPDAASGA